MRAYLAIISARFRVLLQYREAAVAGFITQLFWGLIRVMIFDAFFRSTSTPQPMTQEQTTTYLWLTQALLLVIPMRPDREMAQKVADGSIAYELVRPTDLYSYWFSREIAQRIVPVMLRAAPMFITAGLFLGLRPPASLSSGLAWLLSMGLAILLSCAITTLMAISMLWTISGQGLTRIMLVASYVLSGTFVPLPLYPDWAQGVLNALPFRGLIDIPFRLYMGHVAPSEAWPLMLHQFAWATVLVLLGRWVLSRGKRKLVIQGG